MSNIATFGLLQLRLTKLVGWPNPYERVRSSYPELYWDYYLPTLATFALATYQRPAAEYLDAETLRDSYQAAYRLLFARKLADILSKDFKSSEKATGVRQFSTQTVFMVPVFVYMVESILGLTIVIMLLMQLLPSWRKTNLVSEPGSLASLMALSSTSNRLIERMSDTDRATSQDLEKHSADTKFYLGEQTQSQGARLCCLDHPTPDSYDEMSSSKSSGPILPIELSWVFGAHFLSLHACTLGALAYTFIRAHYNNGETFDYGYL